jgi:hypothetical protein
MNLSFKTYDGAIYVSCGNMNIIWIWHYSKIHHHYFYNFNFDYLMKDKTITNRITDELLGQGSFSKLYIAFT